ncbi:peroxisomal testis-specific protein 1 [Heterocephalus glaber]|uniref:Peroxisomal testis-specific protein 1 n=1 Tax=Heterocephalus glaber TaxID=10181 RepID=A0A0P6IZZ5_HETGA|nr:peroxisomal testis-specific protein 1 [Heterocephalus glaber]
MKKQKQHGIVYDPKQVVIPSLNVASCCHLLKAKYRPQKAYKTGLVCPQPISAMTGSPDHSPVFQPKENGVGQNHHQEEIVRKLAMQLRRIGDGIHRRTVQDLRQEDRDALARFVLFVFGRLQVMLRLFWNNHWL